MLTVVKTFIILFIANLVQSAGCKKDNKGNENPELPVAVNSFYFGADLSYVNQVLDKGGVYKKQGAITDPYVLFKENGTNLVRVRLWHNPSWTKEVYGNNGTQLYSDLYDVEKTIRLAKAKGMKVELDFHYSDTWADPGKQEIPESWKQIRSQSVLCDSIYNYTFKTMEYLKSKGLMPDLVQIGNEINCGMLQTKAPEGFPTANACKEEWVQLGEYLNAGIRAVRDASANSDIKPKILLHVADPKNIEWWFDNVTTKGKVTDFDMIGFSYYPLWHTTVPLDKISDNISKFKAKYNRDIMILETAYPWTSEAKDNYSNAFGSINSIPGYPFTKDGQFAFMKALTREVRDGGGIGLIYWEPAW
ncbi:MAG: glycoside hydrolase family 53 protein, partial [Flavitalea sp.]